MPYCYTPTDLELCLVQQVQLWTQSTCIFKNPQLAGKKPANQIYCPIQVYQGHIPSWQAGPRAEDLKPKAPAIAIKAIHGMYKREFGITTVKFVIVTWDDSNSRRGYIDVANVIDIIRNGLQENVIISQCFPLLDDPILYEHLEDPSADYHPYYLGSVEAKFGIMSASPGWIAPFNFTGAGQYNVTSSGATVTVSTAPDLTAL